MATHTSPLPPYPQMIMEALDALNPAVGANKSTISTFIETKYVEVPSNHSDLLSHHLNMMKDSGDLFFINDSYLKRGPNGPQKRGRGRPPKPKDTLPAGSSQPGPPRSRGRPRKDPSVAPVTKKSKPSISATGRPRGRPKKVISEALQNEVEA